MVEKMEWMYQSKLSGIQPDLDSQGISQGARGVTRDGDECGVLSDMRGRFDLTRSVRWKIKADAMPYLKDAIK